MPARIVMSTTGRLAGAEFRFACVADRAHLEYIEPFLRRRVFGNQATRTRCLAADPEREDQAAREADLVVRVTPSGPPAGPGDPTGGRLTLPLRVNFVADLRASARGGPAISPNERKRQRRRVAAHKYTFTVSTRDRDFAHFYDHMHVPTMAVRHGKHARSTPREEAFDKLFKAGFLLLVESDGAAVAGVLCHADGQVCHARLVGWLGGDPLHLEREAVKTANHFLLDWARSAGFTHVDFQGCEPFLTKGTFQSKRHLGATLVVPGGPLGAARVSLEAGRDSAAVRDVLAANPVIALSGSGGPVAVYFCDAARPPRFDIPHRCHGLGGPVLIDLDEFTRPGQSVAGEAAQPLP